MMLEDKQHMFLAAIDEHKKSNSDLILWGAGEAAVNAYNILTKHGVSITAVAVSRNYYIPGSVLCGEDVCVLEDYITTHRNCDVFVAFTEYTEEKARDIKPYVHKIYNYDIGIFFLKEEWIFNKGCLFEHREDIEWLYNNLCDNESKLALDDFINQVITGVPEKPYTNNQYFDDSIIKLCENEVFIDCGAYKGESIERFINNLKDAGIKTYQRIYGIEANEINYKQAKTRLDEKYGNSNIVLVNKGCWSHSGILKFEQNTDIAASSTISENGGVEVEVQTIDSIVAEEDRVTFITMDIEGAESEALKGAQQTIIKYRPKLAICVYHKLEDLYEIPRYIKELVPEYKLYFRNHSANRTESVLYAVV